MADSETRSEIVLALSEEFIERYRNGERPALREYTDRHPELASEIREIFPAMAIMEKIGIADESLAGSADHPSNAPALEQLGDYRIIREVGRGGMGIVYEAEQVSLGRHVALKVLPNTALLDARHKRRFEREAKSAAKLHHTNIVPVFGVGEQDGLPYYVMQFIQGRGIDEVLEELQRSKRAAAPDRKSCRGVSAADLANSLLTGKRQISAATVDERGYEEVMQGCSTADSSILADSSIVLPGQSDAQGSKKQNFWHSIANVGVQIASALDYAHNQGVLHRDIKPSNLLLDRRGTVWVTDFGLAKANDQENLTHTGDILGTLRYMPPEAFEGKADRRTDVYALGVTLYELLAMRPAFATRDRNQLIHEVMATEPTRLDKLNPAIPRDLVTIVHKAIERDAGHRYATAADLAADLRRFLHDEPIQARRISTSEWLWRSCRRRPTAAAAVAFALLLLVALIAIPLSVAITETNNAAEITKQKSKVEQALKQAHRQSAVLTLERALGVCEQGEVARGLLLLVQGLKKAREAEAEDLEQVFRWNLGAWSRENHALLHFLQHGASVRAVAFSPDSTLVASGGADNKARIWDSLTGLSHGTPLAHPGQVQALAFHPDGRLLTGCEDGEARLWDVTTGRRIGPKLVHCRSNPNATMKKQWPFQQGVSSVAVSPDGRVILTGGYDGSARRWDAASGQQMGGPLSHPNGDAITGVAFHRQGRYVLTAGLNRIWYLWDTVTEKVVSSRITGSNIWGVAFHPSGNKFATGLGQERGVRQWLTPQAIASVGPRSPLQKGFAPDGALVRHYQAACAAAYTRDGSLLLTGGHDLMARFWDAATLRPFGSSLQHRDWVLAVAVSPDNRLAATGSKDGTARVWQIARGSKLHTLSHPGWVRGGPAFDPESKTVFTGGESDGPRRIFRWDVATGKQLGPVFEIPPRQGDVWVTGVTISPDGETVYATDHQRGVVHFWRVGTGRHIGSTQPHGDEVWRLALSPDGRTLLTGPVGYRRGTGSGARLWNARTGKPFGQPLEHEGNVFGLAFRPDGGAVLTGSEDRTTRLWDSASGLPLGPPLVHPNSIRAVTFRPDGLAVALGGADRTAQVWDPTTWAPVSPAMQHDGEVNCVAFNPGGELLLTASTDFTARLWHAATGKSVGPALRHTQDVLAISCSPDGRTAATISDDRTAGLWAMPVQVKDHPEQVWRWAQRVTGLTLGEDGAFRVLSPEEVATLGFASQPGGLERRSESPDLRQ